MDNEIFNENEVQPTPVQPVPTAEPVAVEEVAPIAEPAVAEAPVSAPEMPQEPAPYAPEQPVYAPQQPTYAPQQPVYNAPQQPYYGAPQQPYYGVPQQDPNYMPPAPVKKKKSIFARWWFWVILVVLILSFFGCVGACSSSDSGSSGSGSSGSSTYVPSVSPYVTMVKTTKNSNYGITYGAAFDDFFTNPSWRYFKATSGEHVVEFTGGFRYDGSPATAKVQFIVDTAEGTLQVYHLSINGQDQSKLVLAALVKKVFESY